MELLLCYGALILAQVGTTFKEYSMKNCSKLAPGPFNSVFINLCRSAICTVVCFLIWIIWDRTTTSSMGHLAIIMAGLGTALQLFTWMLAAKIVSLSFINITSMIGSMLLPMILAPYLFDEAPVSIYAYIGSALIFVSMYFFANEKVDKTKKEKNAKGLIAKILIVVGCGVGASMAAIFRNYYTRIVKGTNFYYLFITFLTMLVCFGILFIAYYFLEKKRLKKLATGELGLNSIAQVNTDVKVQLPFKKIWYFILIAAAAQFCYEFGSNEALGIGPIYYPLARGLMVICTFVLDVLYFKDKLTWKKLVGLAIVLCAIVLVYMDKILLLFA